MEKYEKCKCKQESESNNFVKAETDVKTENDV